MHDADHGFDVIALEREAPGGTLTIGLCRPTEPLAPWWIEIAFSRPGPARMLALSTAEHVLAVRALLDLVEADMRAVGLWPEHTAPTIVRPRTHPEQIEALFAQARAEAAADFAVGSWPAVAARIEEATE